MPPLWFAHVPWLRLGRREGMTNFESAQTRPSLNFQMTNDLQHR